MRDHEFQVIDHDGPFPGCGQTNQRSETKGNDRMSEIQKQMADEFIKQKKEGRKPFLLGGPGFLQTFADGDDDPGDDDPGDDDDDDLDDDPGDDDPGDDDPGDDDIEYSKGSIDAILKSGQVDFAKLLKDNPEMKKQYQARFNKNMSSRLKKFDGVDVDEYNDLKQRAESGKLEGDAKTWKDKYDTLKTEMTATSQRTAIQQFGIDANLDSDVGSRGDGGVSCVGPGEAHYGPTDFG